MDGYGYVSKLPEKLKQPVKGVYIFHGNTQKDTADADGKGVWEILKPGHGTGHQSTSTENKLSDRFGIEITFAGELQRLLPNENIALIKYSRGGNFHPLRRSRKFWLLGPWFFNWKRYQSV